MADEEKIVEEVKKDDEKKCKYCELAKKFAFLTGAVYLGVVFAILSVHALVKPKFPCGMKRPCPGIEKQYKRHHKMMKHRGHGPGMYAPQKEFSKQGPQDFRGPRPEGKDIKGLPDKKGEAPKLKRSYVNPDEVVKD